MQRFETPSVPVSWGELLDKITILEIKGERLSCPQKRANVEREHRLLRNVSAQVMQAEGVWPLFQQLKRINAALWDIEDAIRDREAGSFFDAEFVALARTVYVTNDERAAVKRDINRLLKSDLVEEKSYSEGLTTREALRPSGLQAAH